MKRLFTENARTKAREYATHVLPHAEKVGIDTAPMKERMARWVNVVEAYERDIADVKANTALDRQERWKLIKTMRHARDQVREEIFG